MPALPVVPNVLKIALTQTDITALPLGSRLFWKYSGGAPSNADCTAIASSIFTAINSNWPSVMATGDNETEVIVTDLSSHSGGTGLHTGTVSGTRSGGSLPIGVAAVCSHSIARRYRGGKCRTYFQWGVATDYATQRSWSSTALGNFNTAFNAFASALAGITSGTTVLANQVNVSYYSGFTSVQNPVTLRWRNIPKPRVSPLVDDVASSAFASVIGSQRRRYAR